MIPKEFDPYPVKTHGYDKFPVVTCEDAFIGLLEPEYSLDLSQQKYSKAKYMGSHCQGQTEVKLNSVGPTIRSEHHGNIEYRRLSKEHGGKNDVELKWFTCRAPLLWRSRSGETCSHQPSWLR